MECDIRAIVTLTPAADLDPSVTAVFSDRFHLYWDSRIAQSGRGSHALDAQVYVDRKPMEHVLQDQLQLILHARIPLILVEGTTGGSRSSCQYIYCGDLVCQAVPGCVKINMSKRRNNHDYAGCTCTSCM